MLNQIKIHGVSYYCDCMPEKPDRDTVDYYNTAFPEENYSPDICRACGQHWSSECKEIPGGKAIYIYKTPNTHANE